MRASTRRNQRLLEEKDAIGIKADKAGVTDFGLVPGIGVLRKQGFDYYQRVLHFFHAKCKGDLRQGKRRDGSLTVWCANCMAIVSEKDVIIK